MKHYEIMNVHGHVLEDVWAKSEREALCIYLTKHEELNDMMLWASVFNGQWRLAEYDNEDEYMFAKEV